jgi:4-hydroxybenzoate polyprenyltransferase
MRYTDGTNRVSEVLMMQTIIKILLFPITFTLTILVHIAAFAVEKVGVLLNIVSGLLFTGAVIMGGFAIFGNEHYTWITPAILAAVAFLISPYGIPKIAEWLVLRVNDFNEFVKAL